MGFLRNIFLVVFFLGGLLCLYVIYKFYLDIFCCIISVLIYLFVRGRYYDCLVDN